LVSWRTNNLKALFIIIFSFKTKYKTFQLELFSNPYSKLIEFIAPYRNNIFYYYIGKPCTCGSTPSWSSLTVFILMAAKGFNVLMSAVVGARMFKGYGVGPVNDFRLTHLQFADDTLIIGKKSWLNVRTMRAVLLFLRKYRGWRWIFTRVCWQVWTFLILGCWRLP